jgi:transposase
MDTVMVRPLRPYEQKKLRRLKRQRTNAVNCRHARIVLLSRGRLRNRDIATRVGCSPQWVRQVIHRFNAHGLDGITWCPYLHANGAPRRFTADLVEQIAEVALSSPTALIGMTRWSLDKLRQYLAEQRIIGPISREWLRTLLRRLKVRWRRTKTWKESRDPQFWPKYRRIRALYRRRPEGGRRVCVDEFGPLNLQPHPGKQWAPAARGKGDPGAPRRRRRRATYTRPHGVRHLMAALDLARDRLYGHITARKGRTQFLAFCRYLRSLYPPEVRLAIVCDNFSPHLSTGRDDRVGRWAAANNVEFAYTPFYGSWLNRIEAQFTALRYFTLDGTDHPSHREQASMIRRYIAWRNRHTTDPKLRKVIKRASTITRAKVA